MIKPGFIFHPSRYTSPLGFSGLEFYLSPAPVERGFDACSARFMVIYEGELTEAEIEAPWHSLASGNTLRVCAGLFKLTEHLGDELYGFSLGGELEMSSEDELAHGRFTSTAPIFILDEDPESPGRVLADELDGLLAKRQAADGMEDTIFAGRMAAADPLRLFAAVLCELEEQNRKILENYPDGQYQRAQSVLHKIINILKEAGDWPAYVPLMDEIL